MSVTMTYKKVRALKPGVRIHKGEVREWARYKCTLSAKPTPGELRSVKGRFRKALQKQLANLTRGKLFTFNPFLFDFSANNPLKFTAIVPIKFKKGIEPPPGNGTPLPTPAPSPGSA